MIATLSYDVSGATEHDDIESARMASGTTWVRATDTTADERQTLREEFGIHPLSTDDILDTVRPKTEEYPAHTFVLFKTAEFATEETVFRDELETDPVGLFIGRDWLVTLSVTPIDAVEQVWRNC